MIPCLMSVWEKLTEQFQKKSWANKLILRCKLYSLELKEGDSVQGHIKAMTEVFNELTVIGVEMGEENCVIHLASLPKTYSTLVTALEARPEVPAMDIVVEKLLYEERKLQDRRGSNETSPKGLSAKHRSSKGPKCHFCHKFGHIQCNCMEKMQGEKKLPDHDGKKKTFKHRVDHTQRRQCDSEVSESNAVGLVTSHVLSVGTLGDSEDAWIVDSGATCHISNNRKLFTEYQTLQKPLEVSLGDGYALEAVGSGVVSLTLQLPDFQRKKCKLHDVLYVLKLTYNLLSFSKIMDAGKHIMFSNDKGYVLDEDEKLIAVAKKEGNMYYLNCDQLTH